MRHFTTASLAVIALTLGACGGAETSDDIANADNGMMADNGMAMDDGMMAGDPAAMPTNAQEFANMAAASDMYEIESSQLAVERAQRPEVREFAQMLVTDHQNSTQALMAAAGEATPPITVTPQMNAMQQSDMEALRNASDADFDRVYLAQQVPAHETALAMLQSTSWGGDVPALATWADETDDVIQRHLDRARELSR